ncbi:hypothetical protein MTBBW1_710004 [Desulfamplus magnetovallimortis]|uniref:Uncharacterized protein n=1 Tax=Desulfamplus magnetovallimortis TaxID=1246637 RepID=A0A1W1HIV0_9BACT|nr:hypothetical protein MTBBW1_710004 [Desulfamplus magnetovallimortis]
MPGVNIIDFTGYMLFYSKYCFGVVNLLQRFKENLTTNNVNQNRHKSNSDEDNYECPTTTKYAIDTGRIP